ncbi:MAG: TolC family protein [Proteobacteria bacterium]|nr:TolC family protein [Pseudomonadota bacterium]MBU0967263.1 TolC family protein [Pseudomonadota bacterium]
MKRAIPRHILTLLALTILLPHRLFAASLPLADYLTEAIEHNENIQAAKSRVQGIRQKARQSSSLPDPRMGIEYYLEPVETRTGPQEAAVSLSQTLPWPGKLSLAEKVARQDAAMAEARLAATRLLVASRVKQSYVEYAFNTENQTSFAESLELLKYMENVARTRYAAGTVDYANVLKIQIELARAENRLQTSRDQTYSLMVNLNSLLGADNDRARPVPPLPDIILTTAEEHLLELAREHNPKLLEARESITKAQLGVDLAQKDFYPDLTLSVKTIFTGNAEFGNPPDSGKDPIIAGISFNIPLFQDRRHAAVEEKEAMAGAERTSLNQEVRSLEADIQQGLFRYRNATRSRSLYNDTLLPTIHQQVEVALEAFQNGRLSVQELLDAENNLLQFQLARSRALADQAIEVAKLEELVGATLADWQN